MTIKDLTIGTVINYTDRANDSDYIVLDTARFGAVPAEENIRRMCFVYIGSC